MKKINLIDTHDYGFEVPPKSRMDLTRDANAIHRAIGYKGDRPFPIIRFIERALEMLCDGFELEIVTEKELGGKFGETYPHKHVIRLREDIYDNAVDGDGFARMTAAHEVGHLLEHADVPLSMARASRQLPAYRSSEWQANAFAGALLMPASKIIDMDEEDIRDTYGVTISAAYKQKDAIRKVAMKCRLPTL